MSKPRIRTGGVKPFYLDGEMALKVTRLGPNPYVENYLVSLYGWHRGSHALGAGKTEEEAVKDWARQTGNKPEVALAMKRIEIRSIG